MSELAPLFDIGSVKDAIKALLEGPAYEDELVALEARFADGVPLPRLEAVFTSEKAQLPAFPAAELLGDTSTPHGQSDAEDYDHQVLVMITQAGDDEELITRQIERYILAVRRLLRDEGRGVTLMPSIGSVPVRVGVEHFPPVGRGGHEAAGRPFIKAGFLELTIGTIA